MTGATEPRSRIRGLWEQLAGSLSPDFGGTPDPENYAFIGLDPTAILDLFCEMRLGFVRSDA